jgi:hypothetical protein
MAVNSIKIRDTITQRLEGRVRLTGRPVLLLVPCTVVLVRAIYQGCSRRHKSILKRLKQRMPHFPRRYPPTKATLRLMTAWSAWKSDLAAILTTSNSGRDVVTDWRWSSTEVSPFYVPVAK